MQSEIAAPSAQSILRNDSGVAAQYLHGPKRATPGELLEPAGSVLKWYSLYAEALPVPDEITELARAYLTRESLEAPGFGFVLLHRCGRDFYFLLLSTWRGNNELWETVLYKDGDAMPDFALFPRDCAHKPTFCVWELAVVWHEKQSWENFLQSTRDDAAVQAWLQDRYAGPA